MTNNTIEHEQGHGKPLVEITVNKKHKVQIEGPRVTGLQIKEASIAQGVPIELDFQLAEITRPGQSEIVGDADIVTIHKDSCFVATAPDDNSNDDIR